MEMKTVNTSRHTGSGQNILHSFLQEGTEGSDMSIGVAVREDLFHASGLGTNQSGLLGKNNSAWEICQMLKSTIRVYK